MYCVSGVNTVWWVMDGLQEIGVEGFIISRIEPRSDNDCSVNDNSSSLTSKYDKQINQITPQNKPHLLQPNGIAPVSPKPKNQQHDDNRLNDQDHRLSVGSEGIPPQQIIKSRIGIQNDFSTGGSDRKSRRTARRENVGDDGSFVDAWHADDADADGFGEEAGETGRREEGEGI